MAPSFLTLSPYLTIQIFPSKLGSGFSCVLGFPPLCVIPTVSTSGGGFLFSLISYFAPFFFQRKGHVFLPPPISLFPSLSAVWLPETLLPQKKLPPQTCQFFLPRALPPSTPPKQNVFRGSRKPFPFVLTNPVFPGRVLRLRGF